ncbi:MAG: DUF1080 domain-containing protein [Planctomyces sp.]|nr:DUF1080 domain-containing protein [Planctomyces sp.]
MAGQAGRERMVSIALVLGTLICGGIPGDFNRVNAQDAAKDEFRPLFNGKDMTGWVYVNTPPDTWTIEDGVLICSGRPTGEIRTDRMYQNFVLEVEWRHLVKAGNAGIFVWADDITARGVPFHRSVEVQVLENSYGQSAGHTTHGDIFPIHGAKMTPLNGRGGSRAFPTEERSKPAPEWNHYRIECRDGEISLAVNGKVVTQGKDASPRKGYICIESEGGTVQYRNMRIMELPDTPVDPADVATERRGFRSVYSGLDLRGWKATPKSDSWKAQDWVLRYEGKSTGSEAGVLELDEVLNGDVDFVLDVQPSDGFQSFSMAGLDQILVAASSSNSGDGGLQVKAGEWIRLEGQLRSGKLSVTANGKPLKDSVPVKSPWQMQLKPHGATSFANIYVRNVSNP